ncbi:MAG: DUF2306 domain-containing protein [Saprospiraceae bacterium]|nr:DUF2306 domain-containing protein [Saprospiraceae bacterium]
MNTLYGDNIGLTHFIAGIAAVLFGGAVLLMKKGTPIHRKVGYLYVASMVVLVVSSFGIYRLFGKFGLFHGFSLVAVFSLVMGMFPMLKKQRTPQDYETHFTRMYWSVAGLYAAFAAESFIRVPKLGTFWQIVAWSFVLIVGVCFVVFIKKKAVWSAQFGKNRV